MPERVKLTILQVNDVQKVGDQGAEKLEFIGRGADGKELKYFTFSKRLFDSIRNNKEIEADVEVTTRPVGDVTYTDRKVAQVYIGGKAVSQQGGGGRQWYGKSPEEIASIEAQTGIYAGTQLLIAGVKPDDNPEATMIWGWILTKICYVTKLGVQPLSKAPAKTVPPAEAQPIDTPGQAPVEGEKVRLEMFKAQCKRYGWDFTTKKGGDSIAGWLDGRPEALRWKEMTAEAQEEAIEEMRQMADEKEG